MKRVVVTGGSKGIGLAISERFLIHGDTVFICSRDGEYLQKVQHTLLERYPNARIQTFVCDVADREQLKAFAAFVQRDGAVDILVNNAGTFLPGQINNEEEGVFETLINTNLASAYHLTRMLLPAMMERKSGHVFNMCSTASITAYVNGGSYCISKFGLLGMSKVLREEMKPYRIKVTSLLPGGTYTTSWSQSGLPEERFMKPSDIAEVVFMAASLSPSADVEEILLRPLEGDI